MRDTRTVLARLCDSFRSPGERSWLFLQPYSLPEAYLTCALVESFGATLGAEAGRLNVILKRSHAPIARLFDSPRLRIGVADDIWMDSLARDLRSVGLRSTLEPDQGIVLHPHHMGDGRADALLDLKDVSRRQIYQYLLGLPVGNDTAPPAIPEVCRQEAKVAARDLGIAQGQSVILIPHGQDKDRMPLAAWADLASRLAGEGLAVFTLVINHATGLKTQAIPGTSALDIRLDLLLPVMEHAGWVISTPNDTLHLLADARARCRKTALVGALDGHKTTAGTIPGRPLGSDLLQGLDRRDVAVIACDLQNLAAAFGEIMNSPASAGLRGSAPMPADVGDARPGQGSSNPPVASDLRYADGALALQALHEIQFSMSPQLRDATAAAIAKHVNILVPRLGRQTDPKAVQALQEHAIVGLGKVLADEQVSEVVDYFRNQSCFSAHVASYSDGIPRSLEQAAAHGAYGSYLIDQTLRAPHLLDLALNEDLLALCESYLGCLPTLYSVHTWWTFARSRVPGGTHAYHRDQDDHKFLSMFIYLTDVGPKDGPIDLLCGSHQTSQVESEISAFRCSRSNAPVASADQYFPPHAGNGYDQKVVPIPYDELFADRRVTVTGQAGSAFLADTFALHRGNPPTAHNRLACWIRYGLAKGATYSMDRTHQVPASQLGNRVRRSVQMDWVTRLLVDHTR